MRFSEYYNTIPTILVEDNKVEDWQGYINRIPMLKTGVDILNKIIKIGNDIGMDDPKAFIVGGTIRDIITGDKEPDDIDIATNVSIDELEKYFKTHDIGKNKDFGIIVVNQDGFDFEIANFRSDGEYLDGRRPSSIEIEMSFEKDAERRDFTVNAMAVDKDGNVIDYFDGQTDIQNKVIKTVGDPEKRFAEDYIRMLRAIRFASRMDFKIDDKTMDAIKSHSPKIKNQAVERVMKEVLKMAQQSGGKFADAILMLREAGLLKYILPEVIKMDEFEHNVEHHREGNVFQHTIAALRSSDIADPIVNLGILLHDVGKIETYTHDETGHHYFGHAQQSSDMIDKIADRLKLDNRTREALKYSAVNHMKFHDLLDISPSKVVNMMQDPNWDILVSVAHADAKARGELFDEKEWSLIMRRVDELRERFKGKQATDSIRKVVNGKLVMDLLNIKGGPELGDIIKKTVEWILDNNIDIEDMDSIKNKILEFGGK